VGREFGLPESAEVVALLAIGFAEEPDKPYGGRLELAEIVHDEHFGRPWPGQKNAARTPPEMFEPARGKTTETLKPA